MLRRNHNIILDTDSYKVSHWKQYPKGSEIVHSYFESRGGDYDHTVFFGLQYLIKEHLLTPITMDDIDEAEKLFAAHFGTNELFNRAAWEKILEKYDGKLPIRIKAVPEGTKIPVSNVLMTIENTDPDFYWLPNYLETILVHVWYSSTIATNSAEIKKTIKHWLDLTADDSMGLGFKCHDFGFRGVATHEQSGIGGVAHLLSFLGTDTMSALVTARDYYGEEFVAGFSIPAAEHSTITSWGKDHEYDAFENMLDQFPTGLVAIVSDSYNVYNACRAFGSDRFREKILHRDGTVVIRPDSGYPPEVIIECLEILAENFPVAINSKGFKILPPQLRMIQGDGIDRNMVFTILQKLALNGWSADNIAFGSGGGLLQKFNRDTGKFAFKCSAIRINGVWNEDIQKEPITDPGKKSKAGRFSLIKVDGEYTTIPVPDHADDHLRVVYENGELLINETLETIRQRLEAQ